MTYVIEPHIEAYIDRAVEKTVMKAVEREGIIFAAGSRHEQGILYDRFSHDLMKLGEVTDLKIRDTTRSVVEKIVNPRFDILEAKLDSSVNEIKGIKGEFKGLKDEIHEFKLEMQGFKSEMLDFKSEMLSFKHESKKFWSEMKELRLESNRHNIRLARLERATA